MTERYLETEGWSILDRRLVKVMGRMLFKRPLDYKALIPMGLNEPFTSYDLAKEGGLTKESCKQDGLLLKNDGSY